MADMRSTPSMVVPLVPVLSQHGYRTALDLPKGVADLAIQKEPNRVKLNASGLFLSVAADCLRLDSELNNNAPRIIKFTGRVTAITGAAAGYGIVHAIRHSEDVPVYAKASGGAAVVFGAWAGWEAYQTTQARNEYNQMQCKGVLQLWHPERTTASAPTAEARVITDPCVGADVLIRGCTPERHSAPSYEWSTQPLSTTDAVYLVGGMLLVAVAWEAAAAYGAVSTTATGLDLVWAAAAAL